MRTSNRFARDSGTGDPRPDLGPIVHVPFDDISVTTANHQSLSPGNDRAEPPDGRVTLSLRERRQSPS